MDNGIQFLQAAHCRPANRTAIDWIVIHSAEIAQVTGAAASLMRACAKSERIASWHFAVDNAEVTQSVRETDIAFHAPGANAMGIGIELVASASFTSDDWDDDYSRSVISRAANLTAALCNRWNIPAAFVDSAGLLAGTRGITTHAAATDAWHKSDHTDPGPAFPVQRFLDLVRQYSQPVA
jgi:N-acetyl-anhydromuramyl-L-alanine amidase AmpD